MNHCLWRPLHQGLPIVNRQSEIVNGFVPLCFPPRSGTRICSSILLKDPDAAWPRALHAAYMCCTKLPGLSEFADHIRAALPTANRRWSRRHHHQRSTAFVPHELGKIHANSWGQLSNYRTTQLPNYPTIRLSSCSHLFLFVLRKKQIRLARPQLPTIRL